MESAKTTGSLTALEATGGSVQLNVQGFGYVSFQLAGTFTGTITFSGSIDGMNFVALSVVPIGSTTEVTTATATGIWSSPRPNALTLVKAAFTASPTGTAVISISAAS